MKNFILTIFVVISLQSDGELVILKHNIDLDAKSHKGWIRLLNSKDKLKEHGYNLSDDEVRTLKEYLSTQSNRSRSIK